MKIDYCTITDYRFLIFIDKFKSEVGPESHMYNWLDAGKLCRISQVLCVVDNDEIVAVSCEKIYGNYLRIGSPQYTLKSYRKKCRNILFKKDGFFPSHLTTAKRDNLEIFFSVHAFDNRMKVHAENLYKRRISNNLKDLDFLDDVKFLGIHKFHNVDQYLFGYNVTSIDQLFSVINQTLK